MSIGDCVPDFDPIDPPEIRVPEEKFRTVEFYVRLSDPRPDLQLFQRILDYLKNRAPLAVTVMTVSYHRETVDEPDFMVGTLYLGEPIDMG